MKKLISLADVRKAAGSGQKVICMEPGTIVTPAARDEAGELGVTLLTESPPLQDEKQAPGKPMPASSASGVSTPGIATPGIPAMGPRGPSIPAASGDECRQAEISPALIARIVREVLESMPFPMPRRELVKEEDSSGLRLVKGSSVECEKFETGSPGDRVGIKEIFTLGESPDMAAGFMTVDRSSFSWELKYEEFDYVVEGTLCITVDGRTYTGQPGDVFYIPRNTTVTFSSPDNAKFFFVTYPANWAELSKK